jgi:hypothetical protein
MRNSCNISFSNYGNSLRITIDIEDKALLNMGNIFSELDKMQQNAQENALKKYSDIEKQRQFWRSITIGQLADFSRRRKNKKPYSPCYGYQEKDKDRLFWRVQKRGRRLRNFHIFAEYVRGNEKASALAKKWQISRAYVYSIIQRHRKQYMWDIVQPIDRWAGYRKRGTHLKCAPPRGLAAVTFEEKEFFSLQERYRRN